MANRVYYQFFFAVFFRVARFYWADNTVPYGWSGNEKYPMKNASMEAFGKIKDLPGLDMSCSTIHLDWGEYKNWSSDPA